MSLRVRALSVGGICLILALGACRGGTGETAPPSQTPTVSPSPSTKPTPRRAGEYVVTAQGCLRVRYAPSTDAPLVVCVATGETVRADGAAKKADGYMWYHVTYKKQSGWAASEYLARKTSS